MRPAVVLICVVLTSFAADAADPAVRDQVMVKEGVKVQRGDVAFDPHPIFSCATVEAVEGERVWIAQGWAHKHDVMSLGEAKSFYDEQIRQDPSNSKAWNLRGWVYCEWHDLQRAHEEFSEAIRLDPQNAHGFADRGANWSERRDFKQAHADLSEALRLDSKCTLAYFFRGIAWHKQKEFDKAIVDFNQAIQLDSTIGLFYTWRGLSWTGKGLNDLAIADFNRAIERDPKDVYPYTHRAYAWYYKRSYSKAIADYEQALQLAPNAVDSLQGLAWILATCSLDRFRDGKKAVEYAEKACENSNWGDPICVYTLAAAYAESGLWDEAVETQARYNKLVIRDPALSDGRYELDLYEHQKPYRELLTVWESIQAYFWQIIIVVTLVVGLVPLTRMLRRGLGAARTNHNFKAVDEPDRETISRMGKNLGELGLLPFREMSRLSNLNLASTDITDARLEPLHGMSSLTVLKLAKTEVGDAGLDHLRGLPNLQSVDLSETKVTDRGLESLRDLPNLQDLDLSGTRIGDAGMLHLKNCIGLRRLDLSGTRVTDAGLEPLRDLARLVELWLGDTRTTSDGRTQFRTTRTDCRIAPNP